MAEFFVIAQKALLGIVLACLGLAVFTLQESKVLRALVMMQIVGTVFVAVAAVARAQLYWLVLLPAGALQIWMVRRVFYYVDSQSDLDQLTTLRG